MTRYRPPARSFPVLLLVLAVQSSACCGGDPPSGPTPASSASPTPSSPGSARGSTPREWLQGKWRYTSPSAKQLGDMEKRARSIADRDRIRESMTALPRISREYTADTRTTRNDNRVTMVEHYEIASEEGGKLTLRFPSPDGGPPREELVIVRDRNMILETVKGMPYELVRE